MILTSDRLQESNVLNLNGTKFSKITLLNEASDLAVFSSGKYKMHRKGRSRYESIRHNQTLPQLLYFVEEGKAQYIND